MEQQVVFINGIDLIFSLHNHIAFVHLNVLSSLAS